MLELSQSLSQWLEPIATWFRSMNIPEPIVHWGHPLMMGIVVFVMGSVVGLTGWRGRQLGGAEAAKSWADHKKIAPLMFLFIALGYTGGVLSLVMQQQPILQSPHFWTGSAAIVLLTVNALLAAVRFGKNKTALRTTHAYVGSAALCLLFLHAIFGLKLGLSI
ncbi:DUF4079 domain-containing protein [Leptolyngbya sp. NK1-12]|uniref:DUF4079 domain-containing protein n=1 Tax=Leptolyngbya sp. NK1-12 TaxID=2547451 RepID=A0AA97AQQ3_9CYAN|nr:DUF4079 domain-containing protein [Leptolyngbya sp. NK1-12]WNZ23988.1 DUF4079 domain-containing protein [Leptolyngbya sp. NK1-12]